MAQPSTSSVLTAGTPGASLGRTGRSVHGIREPLSLAERIRAVVGYFLTVYRRTWRG